MRYYQNTPIKQWVAEERPREKVIEKGIGSLTEAELIATLLATGTRDLSAIDLGRELIQAFGGLRRLAQASVQDLMAIKGIGKAKAICLVSAFELARRKLHAEQERSSISTSGGLASFLRPHFIDLSHEQFHVLYMNRNNVVLGHKVVSTGGVSATVIDPRIVFKEAMQHMATAVVLAHNHPSGHARPSSSDDHVTERLLMAAEYLDIRVLDHIILTDDQYYSYADSGDLAKMRSQNEYGNSNFRRSRSQKYQYHRYVQESPGDLAA